MNQISEFCIPCERVFLSKNTRKYLLNIARLRKMLNIFITNGRPKLLSWATPLGCGLVGVFLDPARGCSEPARSVLETCSESARHLLGGCSSPLFVHFIHFLIRWLSKTSRNARTALKIPTISRTLNLENVFQRFVNTSSIRPFSVANYYSSAS